MLPQVWRSGRTARVLVVTCIAFSIVTTMIAAAAGGPPGFRRATGSLVAFYVLYSLCWQAAVDAWQQRRRAWRPAVQLAALSLLLVHHVSVLGANARSLAGGRPGVERWFTVAAAPEASLRHWSAAVARDAPLDCRKVGITTPAECRYSSIYSAVAWSLAEARPIRAHDLASDTDVVVTPEAWPASLAR
jgi:hypothetical protein